MECLRTVYKAICCISDPKFPNQYNFDFGTPQDVTYNREAFESNFVRTSKYHWYDFLPSISMLIKSPYFSSSIDSPISTSSSSESCNPSKKSVPLDRWLHGRHWSSSSVFLWFERVLSALLRLRGLPEIQIWPWGELLIDDSSLPWGRIRIGGVERGGGGVSGEGIVLVAFPNWPYPSGEFSVGRSGIHRDCQFGRIEEPQAKKRLPDHPEIQLADLAEETVRHLERHRTWQGVT